MIVRQVAAFFRRIRARSEYAALSRRLLALALAGAGVTSVGSAAAEITAEQALADLGNWRSVEPDRLLVVDTNKGRLYIELLPEFAPGHVDRIREIAAKGWYNGVGFHRVIADFMAQGGDTATVYPEAGNITPIPGEFAIRRDRSMTLDLLGAPEAALQGYYKGFPVKTQSEYLMDLSADGKVETYVRHCAGVASMARTSDPNSATDQFFIMREAKTHLDGQYTAWGRVLQGQDVVMRLSVGEPPRVPDRTIAVALASSMPEARRPQAFVQRTDGPAFAAVRAAAAARGIEDVCELPPVPSLIVDPVNR